VLRRYNIGSATLNHRRGGEDGSLQPEAESRRHEITGFIEERTEPVRTLEGSDIPRHVYRMDRPLERGVDLRRSTSIHQYGSGIHRAGEDPDVHHKTISSQRREQIMKALLKKVNRKGFTLAELLIVVAIIGVLVAISIPVFTAQLEKSREATDIANVRSAFAAVITNYLDNNTSSSMTVDAKQTVSDWQGVSGIIEYQNDSAMVPYSYSAKTSGSTYNVGISLNSSGIVEPVVN